MPAKNEEYARSISLLNKVFAWSSLLLLAGTIWMVWDDYYRPWKKVQREFRALTARKTETSAALSGSMRSKRAARSSSRSSVTAVGWRLEERRKNNGRSSGVLSFH